MLFDAHAHLQDPRLITDIEGVLRRASLVGVRWIVSCGVCPGDWSDLLALARKYSAILPAFGVHPLYIEGLPAGWKRDLVQYLDAVSFAGVGEIGLDFTVDGLDRSVQEVVFKEQLQIASELKRPASIHCRGAWGALLKIMEHETRLDTGFVLHSYSGSVESMAALARLGGYFSFSGAITREGNRRGIEALAAAPVDRILAETDSPDLLPNGAALLQNGGRQDESLNEPSSLPLIVAKIAQVRSMTESAAAEMVFSNSRRLFPGEGCCE